VCALYHSVRALLGVPAIKEVIGPMIPSG
jgi:hypothetical protein